jgi:hypothetical protein
MRRRAAGETVEEIAGHAPTTPAAERTPSLLDIYLAERKKYDSRWISCSATTGFSIGLGAERYTVRHDKYRNFPLVQTTIGRICPRTKL